MSGKGTSFQNYTKTNNHIFFILLINDNVMLPVFFGKRKRKTIFGLIQTSELSAHAVATECEVKSVVWWDLTLEKYILNFFKQIETNGFLNSKVSGLTYYYMACCVRLKPKQYLWKPSPYQQVPYNNTIFLYLVG